MVNKEKLKPKRKSPKTKKNNFSLYVFIVLAFTIFNITIYSAVINKTSTDKNTLSDSGQKKKLAVYVKQYSDEHITQNAKSSNPNFKNISFNNRSSLLGNAISSLTKNSIKTEYSEENGSWLWTPILQITSDYAENIISDSKKRGIKNLYVSIDTYLDIYVMPEGSEKNAQLKKFDSILSDFIKKANDNGITVDAEAGWRNWAELANSYKAFATLSYAIDYNKTHQYKFRGFQYDVEPYLLDYYKEDTKEILNNFINLVDESVGRLDGSDLRLSVVVPEFYDGTYEETPKIFYAGESLYPVEQLLRVLDKRDESSIIIMAYRNFSEGPNGSIEISKDEVQLANKYKTKVVLALETGNTLPAYITFYNLRRSYFEKQLTILRKAFIKEKSFGGTATHYINSLTELQ